MYTVNEKYQSIRPGDLLQLKPPIYKCIAFNQELLNNGHVHGGGGVRGQLVEGDVVLALSESFSRVSTNVGLTGTFVYIAHALGPMVVYAEHVQVVR